MSSSYYIEVTLNINLIYNRVIFKVGFNLQFIFIYLKDAWKLWNYVY